MQDIRVLCHLANNHLALNPDALIEFYRFIEVVINQNGDNICISEKYMYLLDFAEDSNDFIKKIIFLTINQMFKLGILSSKHFDFDLIQNAYIFNNQHLLLEWANLRNVLINCGFMVPVFQNGRTEFIISQKYEEILKKALKRYNRKLTLENLKLRLIENEEAGEKAEEYVLEYEKKRINNNIKAKNIKQISTIDVCAGYDIISFNNLDSIEYDRFIEVKAVSKKIEFYWSQNEIDVARLKGESYHLYLVDLNKIHIGEYVPYIITNPIMKIGNSDEWMMEAKSYFIYKINLEFGPNV